MDKYYFAIWLIIGLLSGIIYLLYEFYHKKQNIKILDIAMLIPYSLLGFIGLIVTIIEIRNIVIFKAKK